MKPKKPAKTIDEFIKSDEFKHDSKIWDKYIEGVAWGYQEGVQDERGRIGLEFKKWFNSKKAEDIEDAIERITGVNPWNS